MARVPLLTHQELAPADRELIWRRGNLYRALANSPEFTARFAAFGFWMNTASSVGRRLQELVILRIASLHGSRFEWVNHVRISTEENILSNEEILYFCKTSKPDDGLFSEEEKWVISFAREQFVNRYVPEDIYQALLKTHDEKFMVDLAGLVGMYSGLAHILDILDVDITSDDFKWLERYPLPILSGKNAF